MNLYFEQFRGLIHSRDVLEFPNGMPHCYFSSFVLFIVPLIVAYAWVAMMASRSESENLGGCAVLS